MEARVCRFVQGLNPLAINEAATAALNSDMNYRKMVVFAQATEARKLKNRMESKGSNKVRSAGNLGSSSGGGGDRSAFRQGPSHSFAQSSLSALPSRPSQQQWSHFRPSQGNRGSYQQGRAGGRFQQQRRPPCPRCGKMHFGACFIDHPICYECGIMGHIQRDCCLSRQSVGRGTAQPTSSAATISAAPLLAQGTPTPAEHGAARGGILIVQYHDVYAFINPGFTLSYVTPYVAMEFGIDSEQLHESFSVSTPVDESIMAARVYKDCVVKMREPLGSIIEWNGDDVVPKGRFISYLEATMMINKGCIYNFVLVMDTDAEAPTLEFVPVVNEFPKNELNLGQRRWLELLKNYDIDVLYHPGKANVVADALSRKSMGSLAHLEAYQRPLGKEVHRLASMGVLLTNSSEGGVIVQNRDESSLVLEVKEKQYCHAPTSGSMIDAQPSGPDRVSL
ncbi:uncharacterized protein [Nicotiana tomentosiformis]|uniref:uncharacterized protein n=1 Tax=Nicotiana tomentosiformis TaxID=4098 RepID=UPI00388C532B